MRRALKDRLAAYKLPSEMKVLDAIPRNAMGKGELITFSFLFYIVIAMIGFYANLYSE